MLELEPERAPDRHCLLVDQGSSRIKWISAVFTQMTGQWILDVTRFGEGTLEDLGAALASGELMPPAEILLASVASDERCESLQDVLADNTSSPVIRLRSEAETCGIRNGYRKPEKLGVDRWMAVIAAAHHHGKPAVVMDLGTATTLDAVNQKGRHLGGLILPGPAAMQAALTSSTAIELGKSALDSGPACSPGEAQGDTLRAIRGGIVSAQYGALMQFTQWVRQRLDNGSAGELKVVVTGGAADVILRRSDYQLIHDPFLVFRGMLLGRYGSGELHSGRRGDHFREE